MSKVDQAVESLDKLAQDEAGRKALAGAAEALSRLFGGHAFKSVQQAPAQVAPPAPTAEKTEFDVILSGIAARPDGTQFSKIEIIKAVREVVGLGLKEAKDFVEKTGERVVKEAVPKDVAELVKSKLEKAGAIVVLR